jgi:DNA polymerase-4
MSYFFHVDVNNAYLSWEAAYRISKGSTLDLRTVPAVVGGDPKTRRGIVLAKSTPAKAYNIQTGESLMAAFSKCPTLISVKPSYGLYMKASNALFEVLLEYSSKVQRFSVDECFMDMSHLHSDPIKYANEIKGRIKNELGFTVNIGIANNKLLAKVASDFTKPDKVHTLFEGEIENKLWPLPVSDLFMVGRATLKKLNSLGIYSIGDLANTDKEFLKYKLKSHGVLIWEYANGIESSHVRTLDDEIMKGLGNSTTLPKDIYTKDEAFLYLLSLCEMTSFRLRRANKLCKVVAVSIKYRDLERFSHQTTLFNPSDSTIFLYEIIKRLFIQLWNGEPIRHLGIRFTQLSDNVEFQYSFYDEKNLEKKRKADMAIDSIRRKYGDTSIMRGSFPHTGVKPVNGGIGEAEYQMMSSIL